MTLKIGDTVFYKPACASHWANVHPEPVYIADIIYGDIEGPFNHMVRAYRTIDHPFHEALVEFCNDPCVWNALYEAVYNLIADKLGENWALTREESYLFHEDDLIPIDRPL